MRISIWQVLIVVVVLCADEAASQSWNYDDPSQWPSLFPTCGGRRQSPTNIQPSLRRKRPLFPKLKTPLRFRLKNADVKMENKGGKTLQFELGPRVFIDFHSKAFVHKFRLSGRYVLQQFHFHWGDSATSLGSEHAFNGRRTSAEAHFVFYNTRYGSITNALRFSNGIVALALLLNRQSGGGRPTFPEAVLDIQSRISQVPRPGNSVSYRRDIRSLIATMKKSLSSFLVYQGSLTTPACQESVTFFISQRTYTVTDSFLNTISSSLFVSATGTDILVNNFRPEQPRNGRKVVSYT